MSDSSLNGGAIVTAALQCAKRGRLVIPLNGKTPLTEHAYRDGTTDPETIRAWWAKWPHANVGIVVGPKSGVCVLDVDLKSGGIENLAKLGVLPPTVTCDTGGGGMHFYFRYDPRALRKVLAPGVELKPCGGYVVAPPSIHPVTARPYTWRAERQLADLPEWVVALCEMPKPLQPAAAITGAIPGGQRNATLTSLAGSMRRRGIGHDAILAALRVENAERCTPPLGDREVEAIAASVAKYAPALDVAAAPTAETTDERRVEYLDLAAIRLHGIPPVKWIADSWLAEQDVALVSGDGGIGKSTTVAALAMAVATGQPWCGITVNGTGLVLVFDEEQNESELARLYTRLGAPHDNLRVACQQGVNLTTEAGISRLERELGEYRPRLVVLDSVQQVFLGVDGANADAVAKVYSQLFRLRRLYGTTFVMIGHLRKPPAQGQVAPLHLVHGSVAFGTQASTVWVATSPAHSILDLEQVKRRGADRTSLRIRYESEGPDAAIVLTGEGAVEAQETAAERAQAFVVSHLAERGTSPTGWIVKAAAEQTPPIAKRVVERALKHLRGIGRVEQPQHGYYELVKPAEAP